MNLRRVPWITLVLVVGTSQARGSQSEVGHAPEPPAAAAWFGDRAALLADIDGDHVSEIAVGAPRAEGGRGALHVVSGATGKLLWRVVGASPQAELGSVLATGGDLDADGVEDVVVREHIGEDVHVDVLSGKDGRRFCRIEHPSLAAVDQLLVVPDLDGDHVADVVLVDRSPARMLAVSGRERKRIHSGPTWGAQTTAVGRCRASLVLCALEADVDGDGTADLACSVEVREPGDPRRESTEWLVLLSGRTGAVVREARFRAATFDLPCLSSGPDLDGDGVRDLLFSSPDEVVALVSSSTLKSVRELWKGPSIPDLEGVGATSAFAGDLDGDGASEVIIGCEDTFFPGGDYRAGLYSATGAFAGRVETTTYAHTRVFPGTDLDRDGLPELLIGLPEIDELWIIDGRSTRPFAKDARGGGPRWWCQRVLAPKGVYVPQAK